jgi:hypothetical protein
MPGRRGIYDRDEFGQHGDDQGRGRLHPDAPGRITGDQLAGFAPPDEMSKGLVAVLWAALSQGNQLDRESTYHSGYLFVRSPMM